MSHVETVAGMSPLAIWIGLALAEGALVPSASINTVFYPLLTPTLCCLAPIHLATGLPTHAPGGDVILYLFARACLSR